MKLLFSLVPGGELALYRHALFGEGIVHWPTIFSIALFPVIVLAYVLLARSEERKMPEQFGEEYRAYRKGASP